MAKIPEPNHSITNLIDGYHQRNQSKPRYHMGCSMLGEKCERKLWLNFRWAVIEKFSGRILRLFRRGHNEEPQVVTDLKSIGLNITHTGYTQFRVKFGCFVEGSLDGIIHYGVPAAPKAKHILEIKTHSLKSFESLQKDGVEISKPNHFVQMQLYMKGAEIGRALYVAVCKNDDQLYTERVKFDENVANKYLERGKRIAMTERLPDPITTRPSWWECKFCPSHSFCFGDNLTKEVNCRTCAHSTPQKDSTFYCERWKDTIPNEAQHEGCRSHVLHPDLVPWQMIDSPFDWSAVYLIDNKRVVNGEDGFKSSELIANPKRAPA